MMKKILCVTLVLIMLFNASFYVNAVESRGLYTRGIEGYLTITNDTARCRGTLDGTSSVTRIYMTITLQKKVLWWWDDVAAWSQTIQSTSADVTKTYSVGGGTYRVLVECDVYAGAANYETVSAYSSEVKN